MNKTTNQIQELTAQIAALTERVKNQESIIDHYRDKALQAELKIETINNILKIK